MHIQSNSRPEAQKLPTLQFLAQPLAGNVVLQRSLLHD